MHEARQSYSAHAQEPVGEGSLRAQEPCDAVSTHAACQERSSTAHAQDPAGHGKSVQTAHSQLPAACTQATAPVSDPIAHDPTRISHVTHIEPIAARTRSAHRAVTETARQGKRKEPAAVTVDAEEQCRGAKRARAGSASTCILGEGATAPLPGKIVLKKQTAGRKSAKIGQKRQPARAVSNVPIAVNSSTAQH